MRRVLSLLILAAAASSLTSCKADKASRASSQMGENASPTVVNAPDPPRVPTASPTTNAIASPDRRPAIVCFGDSLTEGYGADAGQSYPDFLQQDLDQAGYHYRVINEGVSGNTTKDGVFRLQDVVAEHPQVVLLEFGGNDGLRGESVPVMRANLTKMIEALQTAGAKVVLLGIILPPDYGADYIKTFTQTYPLLAQRFKLPLYPFLLKDVYGVPGLMQADNIHATGKGNRIVANNVLPYVEPLLKK